MFEILFGSKNQKLVKEWVKEHEEIVILVQKIMAAYTAHDEEYLKKELVHLRYIAINHIMMEDIEFFRLLKDETRLTPEIEKSINDFTESFYDTKTVLRDFLHTYTAKNVIYDEDFIHTFNAIVDALGKRIVYEEKTLYKLLGEH